jgi:hypothetical protein
VIDAFFDRVERDDLLQPLFPGSVSEKHRAKLTRWIGSRAVRDHRPHLCAVAYRMDGSLNEDNHRSVRHTRGPRGPRTTPSSPPRSAWRYSSSLTFCPRANHCAATRKCDQSTRTPG